MGTNTPNKTHGDAENAKWFTPVILPESPAALSSSRNITGLPRVGRDIAADVYNNIQQWNDYHIKGAKLTKRITQLKADSHTTYPDGLEGFTNDLCSIVHKLSGLSDALEFLASQVCSLTKLHKKPIPMFISLSNAQLIEIVETIAEAYKAEFKVKKFVLENIAHSKNKNETMFYAICWAHQQNITTEINLKLETLLIETGHRKVI